MLKLFDTVRGEKRAFEAIDPPRVGIYVCGPTVYDLSHLGHARVYVVFDTVVRYLRHSGHQVTYVRNYTDVDDKIISRAREQDRVPKELASEFAAAFAEDMARLHCLPPDVAPRVSEHIPDVIDVVRRIEERGLAYVSEGGVYFSVREHHDYGKLSKRKLDDLRSGARVAVDEGKRDPLDFALWKSAKPGEPAWDSPWGPGRPGWHIECSAMSMKYLGEVFDIHGGGMDLIFPHHENEIAQSEAATGSGFARYFMHNGFVNLNQEKMAKSTGNFFTLRELFRHAEPEAVRLFLLSVQYRHPINFKVIEDEDAGVRFPDLEEAQRRLSYFYETLLRLSEMASSGKNTDVGETMAEVDEALTAFTEAMDDDFNTAAALAPVSELFRLANRLIEDPGSAPKALRRRTLARIRREMTAMGDVLGLWQEQPEAYLDRTREAQALARGLDPAWIEARVADRSEARKERRFQEADRLRDELATRGVELQDSPRGTRWRLTD